MLEVLATWLTVRGAGAAKIAELEARLAKGGVGTPACKAAVDALRVALAASE